MDSILRPIVIVGAGMTGMMSALLLRRYYPHHPITIVEAGRSPGGNYRSIEYEGIGAFDQGMRMLYETGIPEFDKMIHGLLPDTEWNIWRGNRKDIAGLFWKGTLQTHSPYIDLRRLPTPEFEACEHELLQTINADKPVDKSNAKAYLHSHLGTKVAGYYCAGLEKLYGLPAERLDIMAVSQPAMNRAVLWDADKIAPYLHQETLRSRIAWPDQLSLPVLRAFDQAALYPKQYGMQRVIESLQAQLERTGVSFVLNDNITHLYVRKSSVESVRTRSGRQFDHPLYIYWTADLHSLSRLLELSAEGTAPLRLPDVVLVHLLLSNEPVAMGPLYHFYCLDPEFHSFRVTNYAGYCLRAKQKEGYPLCMELWQLNGSDAQIAQVALSELLRFGLARNPDDVRILGITRMANLHASCAVEAMQMMRALRHNIASIRPSNLAALGVFSEGNQLLLYEVWKTMYQQVMQTLS